MTRNNTLILSLAAGVAAISLIYVVGFTGLASSERSNSGDQRAPPLTEPEAREASMVPDMRISPTRDPAAKPEDRRSDPLRADEIDKYQLRRALQHKYGRTPTSDYEAEAPSGENEQPVVPPASWSSLPEEYVAGILQEQLIPAAEGCYQDLAASGESGALTLSVAVIGDSEVGGVIDQVSVNSAETSIKGELNDCVRHAAYNMEFDPPEEGQGVQEFDFTIEFSDDEDSS